MSEEQPIKELVEEVTGIKATEAVEEIKNAVYLSKDMILSSDDIVKEDVSVPEWGGMVTVQSMSGEDRDDFEAAFNKVEFDANGKEIQVRDLNNFRARLCSRTMVNQNGKLLFPNPEDVIKLGKKSSRALDRVMKVAQRLNGIGGEDVEKMTKN